ncbi:hypothetical protein HYPSUDRAFT_806692 [Hypholoma sublateritium FD-334 SS-4]|uniref:Tetratricopeptide SHNi-TPR domain-containing protein n=1 Tax=Hypholoma sublateritium (strain FD-334 SS-4) TaxID=945553 RepID=A0A0D2Q949_HYPSF|nr:hypothetical protein HYPSUDRAFT_806692 [Hypholoma sublateritium FD-334 SS-4]
MASSPKNTAPATEVTVQSCVEQAKRAFALRKYEQAIDHYATALELATAQSGEDAPTTADLYFAYGKALLENAIVQSGVLGKEQPEEAREEQGQRAGATGPILSFTGDMEEPVDLFAAAAAAAEDDEDEDGEGEGNDEDGEPEDDFNAAWEVLDLARAIYQKQSADDEEVALKLADTYIALGDVSMETEKFEQAIQDFEAGLEHKLALLPTSSRQIAEAHYKLSMVLDLTSGRLSDAITHAEKALQSVESRLAELADGLAGKLPPLPEATESAKGKGKATGGRLVRDDHVQNMSKAQIESEIKELSGLKDDLALKVEELKTSPNDVLQGSAPAMAAQALDQVLNSAGGSSSSAAPVVINDLTSIVKKKKKVAPVVPATPVEDSSPIKRKAESDAEPLNIDKKARLDTPNAAA